MTTQKQPNWAEWFINNPSNEAGNSNLQAFSDVLGSEVSFEAKIRDLVDEIDTVILIADANRNIMLLHSPKNFGGTRSRPDNMALKRKKAAGVTLAAFWREPSKITFSCSRRL